MVEVGVEVKSSPDKFWTASHASTELIPHHHKSIRIIEGDGISVGTIRFLKYAQGEHICPFTNLNPCLASSSSGDPSMADSEEIHQLIADVHAFLTGAPPITFAEELDDVERLGLYGITDGEIVSFYKTFKATLKVEARGDGSLVKYYIEYEKVNGEVPNPHLAQEMVVKHYNELFNLS
ncbi:hypothetical protein GW17_00008770 [Ensete ventricosum]|nr:hypothetical protein GW17_00008770 [Ensete ventricosum]RZS09365.1 hypothetical protein BHM03_00040434 [Ensete ventricosum]